MRKKKLGEVLRDKGKISSADLQTIIGEQTGKAIHLGELILDRGLVAKEDLASALEEISGILYMDCRTIVPEPAALELIPHAMAERLSVLPIRIEGKRLVVAMASPQNLGFLDELRFASGMDISPRLSFREELHHAIVANYAPRDRAHAFVPKIETQEQTVFQEMEFFSTSSRQSSQEAIQELQADLRHKKTPAVRLVSEIIQIAMAKNASDIHIEPRSGETAVRIRVDGVLRDIRTIPRNLQISLVSRIKILADMDIAERRAPQDGRFMVSVGSRQIDLRISSLPTQYGEKVVLRLLDTSAPLGSFSSLGMPADVAASLSELLALPQGMVLVTGPTGSGKSTTLYSSLNKMRNPSVNIVTVEDPVEYVLPGINQVHVNTKAGLTFASCLRSLLRQDPNIIMVGEIRDKETAEIALKAAQTGHMVLSTLHTNDSVSAIVRLLDLGIPGFMISSSVTGVVAQRLVRKLCACRTMAPATPEFQARIAQAGGLTPPSTMAVPLGCDLCDQTGYKGRLGIYELLRFDDSTRMVIRTTGNMDQIRNTARSNGMRLMQEDAVEKLRDGLTTLEEILRVVPFETTPNLQCANCAQSILPSFKLCPYCGTRCGPQSDSPSTRQHASTSTVVLNQ